MLSSPAFSKNGEETNNSEQQPRNKQHRRGNVEGNYKKRYSKGQYSDKRQNKKPNTKTSAAPVKKESAVKKFFKKLFGFKK